MEYLVLHAFRSYGVMLRKGDVVDESKIRAPRLRRSEGKIIPAVSSYAVPEDPGVAAPDPQVALSGEHINTVDTLDPAATAGSEEKPKLKLSFS